MTLTGLTEALLNAFARRQGRHKYVSRSPSGSLLTLPSSFSGSVTLGLQGRSEPTNAADWQQWVTVDIAAAQPSALVSR